MQAIEKAAQIANLVGGQRFFDLGEPCIGEIRKRQAARRAHGGDARESRDSYVKADEQSRRSIIAFLRSLKIAK